MWIVYIIKSKKKRWYYVGSTNNLDGRFKEHMLGRVQATKFYRPFELVYKITFCTEREARDYEHLLKDKRIEKEKIIKGIENS